MPTPDRPNPADPSWVLLATLAVIFWFAAVGLAWAGFPHVSSNQPLDLAMRIDLNHADPATLQLLPGIGPKLAQQIVARRQTQPFTTVEDLIQINGIGHTIAQRLTPYVTCQHRPILQQR